MPRRFQEACAGQYPAASHSRADFPAAARGRASLPGPWGLHSEFGMPSVVRDPKMLAQEQEVPAKFSNPPGCYEVFLVIQ